MAWNCSSTLSILCWITDIRCNKVNILLFCILQNWQLLDITNTKTCSSATISKSRLYLLTVFDNTTNSRCPVWTQLLNTCSLNGSLMEEVASGGNKNLFWQISRKCWWHLLAAAPNNLMFKLKSWLKCFIK